MTENYYFTDKTKFILTLEQTGRHLMFLRPRRFGKSLWCSILEMYYDVHYQKDFDQVFKGTWIYDNRTPECGKYLILSLNFSVIDVSCAEASFKSYLRTKLAFFSEKYDLQPVFDSSNPIDMLNTLFAYLSKAGKSLYLIIDEYDNFANHLLLANKKNYAELVKDKTAFLKRFFTVLKGGASGSDAPVKRLFITGVTPMTMYDVTSGFNIGENISLNPQFNTMTGFTEAELEEIFNYYEIELTVERRELLSNWYNNYRFAENNAETVYNTDMILYFVKHFITDAKPPKELIDINVRSDYRKLQYLIYTDKKLNGNFELLRELIGGGTVSLDTIVQDFSAFNLSQAENFKSLLFYQGLTTIRDAGIDVTTAIPNETIKRIDIDYLRGALEMKNIFTLSTDRLAGLLKNFALTGKLDVFEYLAAEIKRNTGIRDYIYNEQSIKVMLLTYLSLTNYYVVKSEQELNKGFADILLRPLNSYVEYVGLVEVKYFPRQRGRGAKKPSTTEVNRAIKAATGQLETYANDPEIIWWQQEKGKILQKAVMVFHGWELMQCSVV